MSPMILRNLISNPGEQPGDLHLADAELVAMSDCERCSKKRSQISWRSDSSSRATARSMINRVSARSVSSSVSLEKK